MDKLKAWWDERPLKAKQFFYILGGLVLLGILISVFG